MQIRIQKVYGEKFQRESVKDFAKTGISNPADREFLKSAKNPALRLLELQSADVMSLSIQSERSHLMLERLVEILIDCVKEQGAAERLKSFPFPRQYAYFSYIFVWIFLILLPFGLLDEMSKATGLDWMIVPFSTLISWMFITMEQVGDSSEDPFEMGLNDVPMSAICRNIEIELLSALGVEDLPEPLTPIGDILL